MNFALLFLLSFQIYILAQHQTRYCSDYYQEVSTLIINCSDVGVFKNQYVRHYSEMKYLKGYWSNITKIKAKAFRNLKNVISIDFSNNEIQVLKKYGFDGCVRLRQLYLWGNKIKLIEPLAFKTTTLQQYKLTHLDLGRNQIQEVNPIIFKECCVKTLKYLDLSDNPNLNFSVSKILIDLEVIAYANFGNGFWKSAKNSSIVKDKRLKGIIAEFEKNYKRIPDFENDIE